MDRYQYVMINESQSARVKLRYDVPPVFGTPALYHVLQKAWVMHHLYANDTQIYLAFEPGCTLSEASVRFKLESTLSIINEWMPQIS